MSSEISVRVAGMEMGVSVARQPSLWSKPSGSVWRFRPVTGQNSWKGRFARPFSASFGCWYCDASGYRSRN